MITIRHISILICCAFATFTSAQIPGDILLSPTNSSSRACPDRNAGTVRHGNFTGQSDDVNLTRSFFCINDRLNLIHNGDAEVNDSDPDLSTQAGVGYAWYTCPPTIDRPTLDDVFMDSCLLTDPTPNMGIYVYVDQLNGDALFQNRNQIGGQSIPDFFNGGEPIEIWFAPITIDAEVGGQAQFEGSPFGPCVHVNTAAAFSIVYLTPLSARNRRIISDGAGGCLGGFTISGGLPQFDNSTFYDITIESTDNPGTFATPTGTNYFHGAEVQFTYPTADSIYRVTIEDGKSCSTTFIMKTFCSDLLTLDISSISANQGDVLPVEITMDGFTNMGVLQFEFNWDPNVFEYVSNSTVLIPVAAGTTVPTVFANEGRVIVLWLAPGVIGHNEPDGTVLISFDFRAIGNCGELTDFTLKDNFIAADFGSNDVVTLVNPGMGRINRGTVEANTDICPDDGTGTGTITLTMCGGMAPYTVIQTGPINDNFVILDQNGIRSIPNLIDGNYSFDITDDLGATNTINAIVPMGSIHDISLTVNNPTCSYTDDGSIQVQINPVGTYEIEWSTGLFNNSTLLEVENGQYSITVSDQNGCAVTKSATVNQAPIQIQGVVTDAGCITSSSGRIDATVSGGNSPYIFQWPAVPPTPPSTSSSRQMLMRGTYGLTVTDDSGCRAIDSFTVNADREVQVDNVIITDATCNGGTGDISIEGSTLNAPAGHAFTFDWTRNAMIVNTFISGLNTSMSDGGIIAGQYDVRIIDFDEGLDCYLDTFFVIDEPTPIQMDLVSTTRATCTENNGRFEIAVSGGSQVPGAGYFIDWNAMHPDLVDNEVSQQGLPSDTFLVLIYQSISGNIDFNCFLDTFVILDREEGPEIVSFDSVSVSCGSGMDGELQVFYVRPAGQTFDVAWSDENNNMYTGDRIVGLDPGQYIVTVTASAGCESIDTVSLGEAIDIVLDSVRYNIPTCPNSQNGSITIFARGPGGGLDYVWNHDNGSNNPILPSVGPGVYTVTISTSGSNCAPLVIDTLDLLAPDIFNANITMMTGATCPGICNGTATVSAMGGMGTITYLWSNDQVTPAATLLCAGQNFVVISDDLCSDTVFLTIPAADTIGFTLSQGHPTCFGDQDGFITVVPSGSNPPFNVSWSDGPMGDMRSLLGADMFIATTQDALGCSRMDTFVLVEPDELIVSIDPSDLLQITCAGRGDGRALITVTGGNGDNIFIWSSNVSTTNEAVNLTPDTYTVTVTDSSGCSDQVTFDIVEPDPIQFFLGGVNLIQCFGDLAQFTVDSAFSTAGGPYEYLVNNGSQSNVGDTVNLIGGEYLITVVDGSGCFIDTTITINQPPELSVDIGSDITVLLGDSALLAVISIIGGFPVDSFVWQSSGNDLSCVTCPAPFITPIANAVVTLTVVDDSGCLSTDEMNVFVDTQRKIYIPTGFSPNDDGINDLFRVFSGPGVQSIENMNIFNRWGSKVFEARNLTPSTNGSGGWDGTFRGEELTPAVFIYVIDILFTDNRVITYRGEVQLMK